MEEEEVVSGEGGGHGGGSRCEQACGKAARDGTSKHLDRSLGLSTTPLCVLARSSQASRKEHVSRHPDGEGASGLWLVSRLQRKKKKCFAKKHQTL